MNNNKKGILLVLGTALISGLAVFFSKFAVAAVGNSDVFTTGKNLVVGLILSALVLSPLMFSKLKKINKTDWLKLFFIGIIGGSLPFLLFFKAVSLTSSISAAFIHKTLFIWVSLLAVWLLREKIGRLQYLALALLFFGNLAMLGFNFISYGIGELLALSATLLWAVEFVIAKKVLKRVDPEIVAWARMFFGSIILFIFLVLTGQTGDLAGLSGGQLAWLSLSSFFLLGYVLTWYRALKYLPAVTVTSILVLASPITTFLNNFFVAKTYAWDQVLGSVLIIAAICLAIYSFKKINHAQFSGDNLN